MNRAAHEFPSPGVAQRGLEASPPAPGAIPTLTPREFAEVRRLAHRKFGLDLRAGKEQLVSGRLAKKLRAGGHRSFAGYLEAVAGDSSGRALVEMIDALTTNHTGFLRERAHFDLLGELLAQFAGRDRIDVWCAAASTGEEPYTLACLLAEKLSGDAGKYTRPTGFHIAATDISTRALDKARRAIYPWDAVRALPEPWLRAHFLRGGGRSEGWYRVKPRLAAHVDFGRLNLIERYSHARPFPVIFCRNVMIYFDKPTQEAVVARLAEWLEPGGYLFVGHAESLAGVTHGLEYFRPAVYRKPRIVNEARTAAVERKTAGSDRR
ncbi:MAG: protein-glutamate O-methyltransferase CheR [Bryobacteraceae bacterium]